ncbi:MAG: FecR family protein [Marinifilaceae bacterium]
MNPLTQNSFIEKLQALFFQRDRLSMHQRSELVNNISDREMLDKVAMMRNVMTEGTDYSAVQRNEYLRFERAITRKRRIIGYYTVAATVALLLGTSLTIYLYNADKNSDTKYNGVVLLGDAGTTYNLSEMREIEDVADLRGVSKDSIGGLNYTQAVASSVVYKADMNTIKVPRGGIYNLTLHDGTVVWLNAETELKYPTVFNGTTREVYLKGEGYFDVKTDSARQFKVHMPQGSIVVYGTTFNINAYGDNGAYHATLLKGKVALINKLHEEFLLDPGKQAVLNISNNNVEVKDADIHSAVSWRTGKFIFERCTLEELMRQLERWYDLNVIFTNMDLRKIEYRGEINKELTLKEALHLIQLTTKVSITQNGKCITISK